MILVDTSIWIEFFRASGSPCDRALGLLIEREEEICINGIILQEILQGFKDDGHFRAAKRHLSEIPLLEMTKNTFLLAADIFRLLRKKGATIRSPIDCAIAASAIENKIPLLHNDNDFDIISRHTKLKILPLH